MGRSKQGRKPKRTKVATDPVGLAEVEAETMALLARHGVSPSDAKRNFEEENTLVVPPESLASLPFAVSQATTLNPSERILAEISEAECSDGDAASGLQRLDPRPSNDIPCAAEVFATSGTVVFDGTAVAIARGAAARNAETERTAGSQSIDQPHCDATQQLQNKRTAALAEVWRQRHLAADAKVQRAQTHRNQQVTSEDARPTNLTKLEDLKVPAVRPASDCLEVLVSHDDFAVGKRIELNEGRLLIGRGERCDIKFASADVSRNHCLVERRGRKLALIDSNSTNGVLVNGQRVHKERGLKHGDMIQVNKTVFAMLTPLETVKLFISYGTPDLAFARTLTTALRDRGFDVFFFEDSAQEFAGERIHSVTRGQIRDRDYVLLVCSLAGLERPGLLAEVHHVLDKEESEGGREFLIPIALDSAYLTWSASPADAIRRRIVADFRSAQDGAAFHDAVERLGKRLRGRHDK